MILQRVKIILTRFTGGFNVRLNQFEFLVALKKYGTFSRAAQELFISQPSISAAIKELEDELGFQILERHSRTIDFTPQGEYILARARQIMEEITAIKEFDCKAEEYLTGCVRLGGIQFFCNTILMATLLALHKPYPQLNVWLKQGDSNSVVQKVAEKEIDLGLILVNDLNEIGLLSEIRKYDLHYTELFKDAMCFVVSKSHPLVCQGQLSLTQVLAFPYVTFAESLSAFMINSFRKHGFHQNMVQINEMNSLRHFLVETEAMTTMPHCFLHETTAYNDLLVALSVQDFNLQCTVGWVRRRHPLSYVEEKVAEELIHQCQLFQNKESIH